MAFWALSGDRPLGMGAVGPIPWATIDRYAARCGVTGDEFERFARLIMLMDREWLERVRPKGRE